MLFSANPSGSSTELGIVWINFELPFATQDEEIWIGLLRRLNLMDCFIEVIVNDLTEVNESAFLNLNFATGV